MAYLVKQSDRAPAVTSPVPVEGGGARAGGCRQGGPIIT